MADSWQGQSWFTLSTRWLPMHRGGWMWTPLTGSLSGCVPIDPTNFFGCLLYLWKTLAFFLCEIIALSNIPKFNVALLGEPRHLRNPNWDKSPPQPIQAHTNTILFPRMAGLFYWLRNLPIFLFEYYNRKGCIDIRSWRYWLTEWQLAIIRIIWR